MPPKRNREDNSGAKSAAAKSPSDPHLSPPPPAASHAAEAVILIDLNESAALNNQNLTVTAEPAKKPRLSYSKRSEWWDHFDRVVDEKGEARVRCRHCDMSYKYTGGTGNMSNHILMKHAAEASENFRLVLPKKFVEVNLGTGELPAPASNNRRNSEPLKKSRRDYSKRSECWDHFDRVQGKNGDVQVKCRYCDVSYKYTGGTGNMSSHVVLKHPNEVTDMANLKHFMSETVYDSSESSSTNSQRRISEPGEKARLAYSKRSEWWEHFDKIYDQNGELRVKCKHCNVSYAYTTGTGNMSNHMLVKHPNKVSESRLVSQDGSAKSHSRKFNSDATSAALTAFIIANNHPATLVEQPFFKEFVESFKAPEFNILSACDMEKKIMQSHSHRKSEIISVLTQEGNGRLSVAINLWTYGNTYAVVAVVVSWLTCNFEMKEATIGLREIRGEHTSARIAATYLEILREYNIENHIFCISLADSVSNIAFSQELEFLASPESPVVQEENYVVCFSHIMHSAVRDAIQSVKVVLSKLRKLNIAVQSSPERLERLAALSIKEETQSSYIIPGLDVSTKWNFIFDMIEKSLGFREALDQIAAGERDLKPLQLSGVEWVAVEEIRDFLKPFIYVLEAIDGFKHQTLSLVVPFYNYLLDFLEELVKNDRKSKEIRTAAKKAFAKINKQYEKTTAVYLVATILDPRLKLQYFKSKGWESGEDGRNLIVEYVIPALHAAWEKYKNLEAVSSSDLTASANSQPTNSVIDNIFPVTKTGDVDELEKYLTMEVEPKETDVLAYWDCRRLQFKSLARMARDYLAITASSVASERVFSAARSLVNSSPNGLHSRAVESNICMGTWIQSKLISVHDLHPQSMMEAIEDIVAPNEAPQDNSESKFLFSRMVGECYGVINLD